MAILSALVDEVVETDDSMLVHFFSSSSRCFVDYVTFFEFESVIESRFDEVQLMIMLVFVVAVIARDRLYLALFLDPSLDEKSPSHDRAGRTHS